MNGKKEKKKLSGDEKKKKKVEFFKDKHVKYFINHLLQMPHQYTSQDTNRMTLLFFCLSGLDILGALEKVPNQENIVNWIFSLQILPENKQNPKFPGNYGFIGGKFFGKNFEHPNNRAHITMTYTALACLLILGDDLTRVDRNSIISSIRYLLDKNGCVQASTFGESDVRFIFCACAVSTILNDFSGLKKHKKIIVDYLLQCRNYDHAFAHKPNSESHGGSNFCVISALYMLGEIEKIEKKNELIFWLLRRQIVGFNGRPNKLEDTCYTFWIGGALQLLGGLDFMDKSSCIKFVLERQNNLLGGISKHKDSFPDILHSYLSISGLSILGFPNLRKVNPSLNITYRALRKV